MKESFLEKRFSEKIKKKRNKTWFEICKYFQRYIPENSIILDVGCGFGEFINNIKATKKIAIDKDNVEEYLNKDILFYCDDIKGSLKKIEDLSIDIIFCSNFFEHLKDKSEFEKVFKNLFLKLKKGGKIIIMQPDFSLCPKEYFNFYDHNIIFTFNSMLEFLNSKNVKIKNIKRRFLPYSFKSCLPVNAFFVKIYLKIPFFHYFLGKQFLIIGEKNEI